MKKIFDLNQRQSGGLLVCTCCNTTVSPTEKQMTVDGHQLHQDCGEKLTMIIAVKEELRPIIAELPADCFGSGSTTLERLERACTVAGFKLALHTFCEHLANRKQWLKEKFARVAAAIKEVIERSKLKNALAGAVARFA